MPLLIMILLILAFLCFLIGTVQLQPPGISSRINWSSLGLAFLTLVYLMMRT
jgi:hypothetical protein